MPLRLIPSTVRTNTSTITDVNKKAPIQIDWNVTPKKTFLANAPTKSLIPKWVLNSINNVVDTAAKNNKI